MRSEPLAFASVVTLSHLHFARALRKTAAVHHPDVPHYILLVDGDPNHLPTPSDSEIYVDLNVVLPDTRERTFLTFSYTAFELSCALKPALVQYLFDRIGARSVAYLDADMTLHAPLPPAALPLERASIVLTPHWLTGRSPEVEARWLMYGAFNAGYFAVRNDDEGRRFIEFWWQRCRRFSAHDLESGLFVDQLWLNLVPALFSQSFAICPHAGLNVSWWNIAERGIRQVGDRVEMACGAPLVLFHWSQVTLGTSGTWFRQTSIDLGTPEARSAVAELHRQYSALVADCEGRSAPAAPYSFGVFADDTPVLADDRRRYRELNGHVAAMANPFAESAWFKDQRRAAIRHGRISGTKQRLKAASARLTGSSRVSQLVGQRIRDVRAAVQAVQDGASRMSALATPAPRRTLTDLANIHGSDKGTLVGSRHGYTRVYDTHLAELRTRPRLSILEIGLRHDPHYKRLSRISPSLAMWRDYFPVAEIYGFDINDFSEMNGGRIHIFQGDQGEADQLDRVGRAAGTLDLVIDDGSHASYHQLVTLQTLFRYVPPGGLYIIEDMDWQPPELEASLPPTRRMTALLEDQRFLSDLGVGAADVSILVDGKLGVIRKPSA